MILPAVLGAFSLLFIVANATIIWRVVVAKKQASMVPFLGGVLGAAALWQAGLLQWAWVPAVLDVTCVPALVMLAVGALMPDKKS